MDENQVFRETTGKIVNAILVVDLTDRASVERMRNNVRTACDQIYQMTHRVVHLRGYQLLTETVGKLNDAVAVKLEHDKAWPLVEQLHICLDLPVPNWLSRKVARIETNDSLTLELNQADEANDFMKVAARTLIEILKELQSAAEQSEIPGGNAS